MILVVCCQYQSFLGQIVSPQAKCQSWSPLLETLLKISLVPSKPHFPKFPYLLRFMCLVHEPKNIHFWYVNELFISDFRSFHGLFMAAPCSLTDFVGVEREHGQVQPTVLCLVSTTLCHIIKHENQLTKEGVSSAGHVSPFDLI